MLRRQDVGHRVVVRRIVGFSADRPLFSDALGELVALTETELTLATANGTVRVPLREVHRAKRVPAARRPPAADVISLHATLDAHSRGLLGAQALAACKPGAVVVNTARGGLIDTTALLAALDAGAIAGAALDVLDPEPPDAATREGLVRHPRVILTPHAAWYSEESFVQLKTEVAREAVRVLQGEPPRSPVNTPSQKSAKVAR